MKNDHIFDGIAHKFSKNIYGTTKGQLRHTLLCDVLTSHLTAKSSIIEIGGGTGVMAAFLTELGHDVVLTDASEDVLKEARENLKNFPNVEVRHQYLQEISDLSEYDVLIC